MFICSRNPHVHISCHRPDLLAAWGKCPCNAVVTCLQFHVVFTVLVPNRCCELKIAKVNFSYVPKIEKHNNTKLSHIPKNQLHTGYWKKIMLQNLVTYQILKTIILYNLSTNRKYRKYVIWNLAAYRKLKIYICIFQNGTIVIAN